MSQFPLPQLTSWSVADRRNVNALADLSTNAPRVPWDKFVSQKFKWSPGEHVALIGPTGQGKTTMLINLLPLHPYVVTFATKPRDRTMDALINTGAYLRMERWQSIDPRQYPRRVLWPDSTRVDAEITQRVVFEDAMRRIYLEGNWTVALDELWWFENKLNLGGMVKTFLLQARSLDISLLVGTQRPAWVPREIYTQSTHLMFWRTNDRQDLESISGIGWRSADLIKTAVANLETYQALYVNTRSGYMCRTRCPNVLVGKVVK